ncbi:putative S-adenosyl-L-methionine-dependent methyltransferase superfamily protein isoform 4 [Cocos nucifera]|uniref:Putative S-adenosyl-L-methionine-dependent methyltransferase superfamily protein isoform 4 n=1 Tax=Cocos nucifera TaxID=13894 RepID=A0A8K0N8J4_COCNU|nr:putative S-adenosyl-L-methionine-dependent methyltransferase superfamily protein isoform 4 [Cocos nucifera]
MAEAAEETVKKIQIYSSYSSSSARQVTPFWKDLAEGLIHDFMNHRLIALGNGFGFSAINSLGRLMDVTDVAHARVKTVKVGCGAGNTVFPLLTTYHDIFVHACDFSPRAIDLIKERLTCKEQQISENFYVRGDGTRAYYFSEEFLTNMFVQNGFDVEEVGICNKRVENRSLELVMNRIKALAKEYQHTCKSTGLMLWESARLMCNVLAENPSIVSGKRVLELGCGSAGICSIMAIQFAKLMVSTDGDIETLNLLRQNIISNVKQDLMNKIMVKKLTWGNNEDVKAIKDLCSHEGGFEVIIGTDVTYNHDAILPLFETARELISDIESGDSKPALILCHIQRRVDEGSIISIASQFGFWLVDKWANGMHSGNGMIGSWFGEDIKYNTTFQNAPLTILYFNI